jgi:PKD repeat protein
MRAHTISVSRPRLAWLLLLSALIITSACGDDSPTQPSTPPPTPQPTVTVTAGRITQSPTGIGIVLATPFSFTATGFSASDNSSLTYTWDFGDGARQTGGATVTHTYAGPGVFTVSATGTTPGGATASTTLGSVVATTVTGRWGLQDITGAFILRNSSLNQNMTTVAGDDTRLNCRFAIQGSVEAPRNITLTWTHARNDCIGQNVPETVRFTGTVDEAAGGFVGTVDNGTPARLVPCANASCF